ncbi:MAG: hypothetical protein ACLFP6_08650 [Spirochaetaceae bacterium]
MSARGRTLRSCHPLRLLLTAGAAALFLSACNFYNPEYYNPLDPALDAPIEEVIDQVVNPNLRQAILDTGATTKFDVGFVSVFEEPVDTLEGIEFFSQIRYLELNNADIVALGTDLTVLRDLPELRELNLMANGYDDTNLDLIPFISQLTGLDLGFNDITDAASLVPIIRDYGPDFFIGFGATLIEGDTLGALTPVLNLLSALQAFDLAGTTPMEDLNWLTSNDTIRTLGISQNPLPEDAYADLSQLSNLRRLEIRGWQYTDLTALPSLPELEILIAEDGDPGFTDLNGVPSGLREFSVENSVGLFTVAPLRIGSGSTLNTLDVSGTALTDDDMADLFSLRELNFLRAGDLPGLTTIEGISNLARLDSLQLFNNQLLASGISEVGQLPNLTFVDFSGSISVDTTILDQIAADNPNLTIIYP